MCVGSGRHGDPPDDRRTRAECGTNLDGLAHPPGGASKRFDRKPDPGQDRT